MTVYNNLTTLISSAQSSLAGVTDMIAFLEQDTSLPCFDFKIGKHSFIVNDGSIRLIGRGVGSTWTLGVGWDAGYSQGSYGNECIIYRTFLQPITVQKLVVNWENLQGTMNILVEGFNQGAKVIAEGVNPTAGMNGEWTRFVSPAQTIDKVALFSSNLSSTERLTFTKFRLE